MHTSWELNDKCCPLCPCISYLNLNFLRKPLNQNHSTQAFLCLWREFDGGKRSLCTIGIAWSCCTPFVRSRFIFKAICTEISCSLINWSRFLAALLCTMVVSHQPKRGAIFEAPINWKGVAASSMIIVLRRCFMGSCHTFFTATCCPRNSPLWTLCLSPDQSNFPSFTS